MSRSLHTQKLSLRAERRLARRHASRRDDAVRISGRRERPTEAEPPVVPVVRVPRPLPGTVAPVRAKDICALIAALGPVAAYGLRAIRLRTECRFFGDGIVFAEYVVPGEIRLYMSPEPPWRLAFVPSLDDLAAFERRGARVTVDDRRQQTTVAWEPDDLKAFYLYEVLAHEIGHHLLQYHKGKRGVAVCRRHDHELWAGLYSRRVDRMGRRRHGG